MRMIDVIWFRKGAGHPVRFFEIEHTNACSCRLALVGAAHHQEVRYLVHFAEGGSGMRRYDEPLREAAVIRDGDAEYVVTRVDQPRTPNGLGHAWLSLA
jgi:hypothetical protein